MIDINYILQTYNPCVLTINETWLNSNIQTSELFIDNRYAYHRLDRLHKQGGGLITLVDKRTKSNVENTVINDDIELLHTLIYIFATPVNIINIYRPPNSSISNLYTY